jgi:hypothetical protein
MLALQSAGQIDVPRERIGRPSIALTTVALPLCPTCIITPILSLVTRCVAVVPRTAAERAGVVVMTVALPEVGLPPVVIAITVVGGTTASPTQRVSVPLVVAGVVVARI